jgi:catechol 2,3-dioxygenase-like lactoylglutathione lyase family enzyme
MSLFTHVVVGTNQLDQASHFYDAVLGTLNIQRIPLDNAEASSMLMYGRGQPEFMVTRPIDGKPATFANGGTIGFAAKNNTEVDAFHAAALANGGSCEGAPGPREQAGPNAYIAYIKDPDGNKLCAFKFS